MNSSQLEQQIARIHEVLELGTADVTWNDRIADPDNPKQTRQIDVTIRRGSTVTMVECRLRSRPQDVMWIEELAGRRMSLRADCIIAVSSSGYTEGARIKAEKLGVILRDLTTLTDEEISSWGKKVKVRAEYVVLKDVQLYPVLPESTPHHLECKDADFLRDSNGDRWPFPLSLKSLADRLEPNLEEISRESSLGLEVRAQAFPKDLYIGGYEIREMIVFAMLKRVAVDIALPAVVSYGSPTDSDDGRTTVQRPPLTQDSRFEVVRTPEYAHITFDFSSLEPVPGGYFRSFVVDMGGSAPMRSVAAVGIKDTPPTITPMVLTVIYKEAPQYGELMRSLNTE